jgi:hypothetical protein
MPRNSAYSQAFKIELTGTEKEKFMVSYSVHVEKTNVDTSAQEPVGDFPGSDGTARPSAEGIGDDIKSKLARRSSTRGKGASGLS